MPLVAQRFFLLSRDLNDLWLFRLLIRRRFDFSTRERFSRKANSIELSAHIKQCLRRSTERLQPVAHKWSHCNNRCNIADNNLQASLGDRIIVIFPVSWASVVQFITATTIISPMHKFADIVLHTTRNGSIIVKNLFSFSLGTANMQISCF